ncbi:MAG TPA: hypothetical protein VLG37_05110 [Candidatus Saccharimonadales bacterium]|nr:hypothetical protein [Candidatus Saccharimonadales bacterium]
MAKKSPMPSNQIVDLIVFFLAWVYMQSVLTVAHHTAYWVHDGSAHIVEKPAVPSLIIGLILIAYSWHRAKGKLSILAIIALTIFATASLFWLSGLRTNFYF